MEPRGVTTGDVVRRLDARARPSRLAAAARRMAAQLNTRRLRIRGWFERPRSGLGARTAVPRGARSADLPGAGGAEREALPPAGARDHDASEAPSLARAANAAEFVALAVAEHGSVRDGVLGADVGGADIA